MFARQDSTESTPRCASHIGRMSQSKEHQSTRMSSCFIAALRSFPRAARQSFMLPTTYGIINSPVLRRTRRFYDGGRANCALRVNRLTSGDLSPRRLFDSPTRRASLIEKRRSQLGRRRRRRWILFAVKRAGFAVLIAGSAAPRRFAHVAPTK